MKYLGLGFHLKLDDFNIIIKKNKIHVLILNKNILNKFQNENNKIDIANLEKEVYFNLLDIDNFKIAISSQYKLNNNVKSLKKYKLRFK